MLNSFNKLPRPLSLGLAFPLIFLNGWLLLLLLGQLQPLVSILIVATLIAFLLDYPIRFLQQTRLPRGWAVGVVLLLFLVLFGVLGFILAPLILQQANELIMRLPEWLKSGQQQLESLQTWAAAQKLPFDLSGSVNQLIAKVTEVLRSFTRQLIGFFFSAIGSIANVFLTLVFAVFLVLRGTSLWDGILSWLPVRWNAQIRQSLPQNFERYIAGQVTLITILGVAQTTALFILGIPRALLFGAAIGVASLIPFGGISTIIVVSLLLALQNFWLGMKVLAVALIISQLCENVIGPRLVGELTGLNPVWMLISLFIGLKLGGPVGLVVTVPIASFIKGTVDAMRTVGYSNAFTTVADEVSPIDKEDVKPAPTAIETR